MKNRCKQSPVEQHSFEQAFYLGCTITREWDNHGTSLANIEYRRKSIMSLIRTSRFSITSVSKWPSSVARDHEHALLPQRGLEHPSGVCEVPGFVFIEYFFYLFYLPIPRMTTECNLSRRFVFSVKRWLFGNNRLRRTTMQKTVIAWYVNMLCWVEKKEWTAMVDRWLNSGTWQVTSKVLENTKAVSSWSTFIFFIISHS